VLALHCIACASAMQAGMHAGRSMRMRAGSGMRRGPARLGEKLGL
jgi:hypothetical protein